ncbi:MAG: ABC transporter substrate-binding protein [Lachnospiraceae bacterium]|nr:ABC transporter substrate-binding protein [Lachnospiraceae bacterium]
MYRKLCCLFLALIMLVSAAGCTTITVNPGDTAEEHVPEVEWYINEQALPDCEEVGKAMADYIYDKLKIKVNVHYPQDYSTVGTALAAGQDAGVVTFGNELDFATYVGAGALYPLDEVLEKYGQGVKALFSDEVWKAMTVNGHIYGIPIKKDNCYLMSLVYNADLAEELGLDLESLHYNNWNDIDEQMLYDALAKRDELHPEWKGEPLIGSWLDDMVPHFFGVESFLGYHYAVCSVPKYQDVDGIPSDKVFNLYETDAYREVLHKKQRLVASGVQAYDYSKITGYNTSPAVLLVDGWGLVFVPDHLFGDAYTTKLLLPDKVWAETGSYTQCLGIAANCKEPEAAMQLLELINTDPWLATTLRFGIEGKHYTRNEEGKIEITPENSDPENRRYYHWYGASMGNLMVVEAPESLTGPNGLLYEKIEYYNNNAINSAHLGFIPDTTNIATEIAACNNVVEEYVPTLGQGQYESEEAVDAALDEFIEKLKANGVDKIIEEIQRQIDEFMAGK